MTLRRVRPASINSGKLLAFLLIAVGIVAVAYYGTRPAAKDTTTPPLFQNTPEKKNTVPLLPVAITWKGAIVMLAVYKRRPRPMTSYGRLTTQGRVREPAAGEWQENASSFDLRSCIVNCAPITEEYRTCH
jgi:hypothetical protein